MPGNSQPKSSKSKVKNPSGQSGQNTQTVSNGGQSVDMQTSRSRSGWGDGNMNSNGVAGGIHQPTFANPQGYTQQFHGQTLPAPNMQNQFMNMNTNQNNQGQWQGHVGQNTQQSTAQYDQGSGFYAPPQPNLSLNNNSYDNSTIINMIQQLNNNFTSRLSNIENSVSKLSNIECEISYMRTDMSKLQLENANMSRRMFEVEKSCQTISNMFDDAAKARSVLQTDVSVLKTENSQLRSNIDQNVSKFEERCSSLNSELQELKARSMQSNLVFYGLAEAPHGDTENTESKLKDFLKHELELEDPGKVDEIVFDRVHRLGRPKWNPQDNPRPIVAKFERYKDREFIRQNSKALNEKRCPYYIREQFPPAIEAARKQLYPIMRQYSRDPANRVALVRDKLYINNRLYVPPDPSETSTQRRDMVQQRDINQGDRRLARGIRLAQLPFFESRNRFGRLAFVEDNNDSSVNPGNSNRSSKRPASSPAYDETSLKKLQCAQTMRENLSHDSSIGDMQIREGTTATDNEYETSEHVIHTVQNDPIMEMDEEIQPVGSQVSSEDPINVVSSGQLVQINGSGCITNDPSFSSGAPVPGADVLPLNTQTVTVEVHQATSQVDENSGENGIITDQLIFRLATRGRAE